MKKALTVLSLGAGVQSSVMALMAAKGELTPRVDAAIFADTEWEPSGVYDHLDWLESIVSNPLMAEHHFPIYRVSAGNIRAASVSGGFDALPFFGLHNGDKTMGRRQCTNKFKIVPIRKKTRELLGLKKGERAGGVVVNTWIGISTDEASRMKPSRDKWNNHMWPLIDAGMSRVDCLAWFEKHYSGRTLAKSACIGCPFRNGEQWRDMKMNQPEEFKDAVDFDKQIRDCDVPGMTRFIHPARIPLGEVDLRNLEDKGQLNMFENECEGMCGV